MIWLLLASIANAGGLDLLEVGGVWGTPGATNPTAIWWNPAGLAGQPGTQLLIEGAPVLAKFTTVRTNPNYGEVRDPKPGATAPDDYNYAGTDTYSYNGLVPFAGVKTDFGVEGLGIGLGLTVPIAKGGKSDQEWGANRYALREGNITALDVILGGAYNYKKLISIGVSGQLVSSTWMADTDTEGYSAIRDVAADDPLGAGFVAQFQDPYFEERGYTVGTKFDNLKDTAFTFGAGIRVTPIDKLALSFAYNHGVKLNHEGPVTLTTQCPPDWDLIGKLGAQQAGICDPDNGGSVVFNGDASVSYKLPSRMNFAATYMPTLKSRFEAFGGIVNWGQFTDYHIITNISKEATPADLPDEERQATAALLTQERDWARDNKNTYFLGLDAKGQVHDFVQIGGRVLYDHSAVPTEALTANNWDASTVVVGGLVAVTPLKQMSIGLSFGHSFIAKRTNDTSVYGLNINPSDRKKDRYFYPESRGTYTANIDRIGIAVRGLFGGKDDENVRF